jgi:hypothetical protein
MLPAVPAEVAGRISRRRTMMFMIVLTVLGQIAGYACSRWLNYWWDTSGVYAGVALPPTLFLIGELLAYKYLAATGQFSTDYARLSFVFLVPIGLLLNLMAAALVQWGRNKN